MKKAIFVLAVIGMLIGVSGLAMACSPEMEPKVKFDTKIKAAGEVSVNQYSKTNLPVEFKNDIKGKDYSTLNINQVVKTQTGLRLANMVRLHGMNPVFKGKTMSMGPIILFGQKLSVEESHDNGDEVYSKNVFSKNGKYASQEVIHHPTANGGNEVEPDTAIVKQKGKALVFGSVGFGDLSQKVRSIGDITYLGQKTNLGGFSKSEIVSENHDWSSYTQKLSFGTGMPMLN